MKTKDQKIIDAISENQKRFLDSVLLFCSLHGLIQGPQEIVMKDRTLEGSDARVLSHLEVWCRDRFLASFIARFDGDPLAAHVKYDYKAPPTFALIAPQENAPTELHNRD